MEATDEVGCGGEDFDVDRDLVGDDLLDNVVFPADEYFVGGGLVVQRGGGVEGIPSRAEGVVEQAERTGIVAVAEGAEGDAPIDAVGADAGGKAGGPGRTFVARNNSERDCRGKVAAVAGHAVHHHAVLRRDGDV